MKKKPFGYRRSLERSCRKPKPTLSQKIYELICSSNSLGHSVTVEADRQRHCHTEKCDDSGICRCSTLENIHITEVDILGMTDYICDSLKISDEITKYCINRILTSNNVYDCDMWSSYAERGYYGEEYTTPVLNDTIKDNIYNNIDALLKLDINERIPYVLTLEYGYLLDSLKNMTWETDTINRDFLIFGNKEYHKKIDKKALFYYKDYPLPLAIVTGVVEKDGFKYRIVDGYHRTSVNHSKEIKVIIGKNA